jgi:DNA-binding PadR family transcriptional regulator
VKREYNGIRFVPLHGAIVVRTFVDLIRWIFQKREERRFFQEMLILGILRADGPSDEASIRRHLLRFTGRGISKCVSAELPVMERKGFIERVPCRMGGTEKKWRITPEGWVRHEEWKTSCGKR